MVIGVRNDLWEIYRTITTYGLGEYVECCNFLTALGLTDCLVPGETADGFDSIFGED